MSEDRLDEAAAWADSFEAWQEWAEHWLNKREPGFWNNYVDRTQKPDPPAWLDRACGLLSGDKELERPCSMLVTWREDPLVTANRRASAAALLQKEEPTKTAWWQHVHVDGLWSTTQSNVMAFGLFGAHATVDVAGRFQAFVAPGILLVSLPTMSGTREVRAATDWGVSYRLFQFGRSTMHFNMVNAWLFGGQVQLLRPNLLLAGFSVTFRNVDTAKRRQ